MIVITTPTGNIGHQILEDILASGSTEPIRVIVRNASKLKSELREKLEVIEGSHNDPAVLDKALAGADALFWLVPPNYSTADVETEYTNFTRPAVEAIRKHGVKRVVVVSALGRDWPTHTGLIKASLDMDDLLASTGVHLRALTLPSFMDNMLQQAQALKAQGMFFGPMDPDAKNPTCATRDIAAVAAKLLLDPSWTGQADVPVLGPEDLSCNDMAQVLSEVLGKPIRYQQVAFDAFQTQLTSHGMSESMAQGMVAMMRAKNDGLDRSVPRTPENTTPTSFRQWSEQVLKPAVLS